MWKRIFKIYILLQLIAILLVATANNRSVNYIAHAGGGIQGEEVTYLNSLEGFTEHYNNGTRLFEFDFLYTSDNEIVAMHDYDTVIYGDSFSLDNRMSLEEFKLVKVKDLYTGLTLDDIFGLMNEYPDMILILDTKENEDLWIELYEDIYNQAMEIDEELVLRIIPQAFNKDMYYSLEETVEFNSYIFTLYKTDLSNVEVLSFLRDNEKIDYLVFPKKNEMQFLLVLGLGIHSLDVDVYTHTVNSDDDLFISKFFGVDGVYTDYIYSE